MVGNRADFIHSGQGFATQRIAVIVEWWLFLAPTLVLALFACAAAGLLALGGVPGSMLVLANGALALFALLSTWVATDSGVMAYSLREGRDIGGFSDEMLWPPLDQRGQVINAEVFNAD